MAEAERTYARKDMRNISVPETIKEISRRAAEERLQEQQAKENLQAFLEYEESLLKEADRWDKVFNII